MPERCHQRGSAAARSEASTSRLPASFPSPGRREHWWRRPPGCQRQPLRASRATPERSSAVIGVPADLPSSNSRTCWVLTGPTSP